MEIGLECLKAQRKGQSYIFSPTNEWCLQGPCVNDTGRKRIRRRFRSINAHVEQERSELCRIGNRKGPTTVVTAKGEVQTKEEATVNDKELGLFLTVKLPEDTPAVLSLGKLCEDHGYFIRVDQWPETTSHRRWQTDKLQHGEPCTDRCPWFIDRLEELSFTYISDISNSGFASRINWK